MNFKISIRERKPRKSEKVCRTTPWPFGEISMDPLGYWWFYLLIDVSKVIGGDSEVIGEFDEEFRASWWVFSIQSYWWSPLSLSGCCPSERSYLAEFLWDCSRSFFTLWKGGPKFLEGLLCNCEWFPGNYYPWPIFSSCLDEEGLKGMSSLLSDGIYFVCIFSNYYVEEERTKYRQSKIFVSNVLRVHYYLLILSRSDSTKCPAR